MNYIYIPYIPLYIPIKKSHKNKINSHVTLLALHIKKIKDTVRTKGLFHSKMKIVLLQAIIFL